MFKDYGAEWRRYRRELHVSFVPDMMNRYFAIQRQYTRGLLRNLLDAPADFSAHIKLYAPLLCSCARTVAPMMMVLTS